MKKPSLQHLSICVLAAGAIAAAVAIPATASSDRSEVAKTHAVKTVPAKGQSFHPVCTKRHHGHKLCADVISGASVAGPAGHGCNKNRHGDKFCAVDIGCATISDHKSVQPLKAADVLGAAPLSRKGKVALKPVAHTRMFKAQDAAAKPLLRAVRPSSDSRGALFRGLIKVLSPRHGDTQH